jgi:hypothetical protein
VFRVAGLSPDSTAVLNIVTTGAQVIRTSDPRCTAFAGVASCQVSGADPAPVAVEVVAPQGARVVATLVPVQVDPDPDNNVWRADLG